MCDFILEWGLESQSNRKCIIYIIDYRFTEVFEVALLDKVGSLGVTWVEKVVFTILMQIQVWLRWGRAHTWKMASVYWLRESRVQHRQQLLSLQPSPWSHTTQFLPIYLWCSWSAVLPSELRVSAWGQVSLYWPFKRIPGFPAAFCSVWRDKMADFCSQMLWGIFFLALWGWDLSRFRRDLFSWNFPPNSQPLHVGGGQLYLLYQPRHGFFFIFLVIRPLFS